jgi:translation elongation factor P/translation initiation factor 5A
MPSANDLRKGMAIIYNGEVAVVLETQHRTPGNLRAFVQATIRSIKTGKSSDVRFSSTERIETIPMMTRKMDFSYKDGEDYVFSDRKRTKPSRSKWALPSKCRSASGGFWITSRRQLSYRLTR